MTYQVTIATVWPVEKKKHKQIFHAVRISKFILSFSLEKVWEWIQGNLWILKKLKVALNSLPQFFFKAKLGQKLNLIMLVT